MKDFLIERFKIILMPWADYNLFLLEKVLRIFKGFRERERDQSFLERRLFSRHDQGVRHQV